jgi:hypothetical protein
VLEVGAELAELDDRRSTPADRVGRERQHERHPVRLAERLALAQDALVARRGLDGEPDGFEPADELANVLSRAEARELAGLFTSGGFGSDYALLQEALREAFEDCAP